jgi:hypothetical protein
MIALPALRSNDVLDTYVIPVARTEYRQRCATLPLRLRPPAFDILSITS